MKKALILGCSHSVGAEMSKEPGLIFNSAREAKDFELTHCYPAEISRALGYEPINQGIWGGSNDAMFRLFLQETLTSDDIVIACWTGVNRSEIYHNDWLPLAPGGTIAKDIDQDFFKHWILYYANEQIGMPNKIKNILALNALAQSRGLKVINIDSFWPVSDFKWPSMVRWPIAIDFISWCLENKFTHTDWGHFFKPAHQGFADFVVQNTSLVQW